MELEVNRMIGFDHFLATGNSSCQLRVSFLIQLLLNVVFARFYFKTSAFYDLY